MGFFAEHFGGLARFSGRESPKSFWLWVFAVVATGFVGWVVSFGVFFTIAIGRMNQFAREHPDQVTTTSGPGGYSTTISGSHPELMPDGNVLMGVIVIIALAVAALLAAAVVRRLHDGGRPGTWGLLPVPFLLFGLAISSYLFSTFNSMVAATSPPEMFFTMFALLAVNNVVYLVMLVILAVLCCTSSEPGPNRFGAPPMGEMPR